MGPWLSPEDLEFARRTVPMAYVTAVPVQLATDGTVESVGALLRASEADGTLQREVVSGRVFVHESLRAALVRHLERDLGTMCFPQLPAHLVPFTVAEFFPLPGALGHHDTRQHAIALCYIVPVSGEFIPQRDVLEVSWLTPHDLRDPDLLDEFVDGHATIVRQALAHCGRLT